MQVRDQIEFHNVAEFVPVSHPHGVALSRYDGETRAYLSALGRHAAACSDGVELRFVTGSSWVNLTLSARSSYSWSAGANVTVFRGDIPVASGFIADGATQTLKLAAPPLLAQMGPLAFGDRRFAPELWRVFVTGATVIYHGIDTVGQPLRPPHPDEKPTRRWLAYGSSITNVAPGYVHHAARHIRADVYNKGLCGSCACESQTSRFLASYEEWDFATLEIGVNMRGSVSVEDFEQRARTLVGELRKVSAVNPIILITIFPNAEDYMATPDRLTGINRSFREMLRRIQASAGDPNLHLIEGDQVLTTYAGLSSDLIHPSQDGHYLMGQNLAGLLAPLLR